MRVALEELVAACDLAAQPLALRKLAEQSTALLLSEWVARCVAVWQNFRRSLKRNRESPAKSFSSFSSFSLSAFTKLQAIVKT
jgi:hypothetical protein